VSCTQNSLFNLRISFTNRGNVICVDQSVSINMVVANKLWWEPDVFESTGVVMGTSVH
jgi:hypothetical protein